MSRKSRKRKSDGEEQTTVDGEQDNFFSDEIRDEMETMWEIPQIFHFLHLTRESLNIPQLSMYEMERMLSIPRASKQLANIMTCLLSSPITKAKLRKVPPMPYEFWTNILTHKMASWFKVYHAKHKDATKVLETIGVEPEFWNMFPDASLLDGKDFENMSFRQRTWLLKTVCDTIMHTRKTVQEDMAKQPWEDQFETSLGLDRYGARYIYFPQFIATDLRIYRLCLDNKILSTVRPMKPKQEANLETSNSFRAKLNRYRMRRAQSSNNHNNKNLSEQPNGREIKVEDKDLSYKCNIDSATNSFISEDTNLSSTSTCSNNNNISLDAINRKRSRSLSKMSEESTMSNARSSGYDTNTSSDNRSLDDDDVKVFKGFSDIQGDNCKIGMINEMLDDLKTEIEDGKTNGCESDTRSNGLTSQEDFEGLCKKTENLCVEATLTVEKDKSERSVDSLIDTSKTDDEKLNEIISAESTKLLAGVSSKSVSADDDVSDNISKSSSKSDDEKLSETKTNSGNISASCKERENGVNKNITFNGLHRASFSNNASPSNNELLSEQVTRSKNKEGISPAIKTELKNSVPERTSSKRQLRPRHRAAQRDAEDKTVVVKKETKKRVELEDDANENLSTSDARLEDYDSDDDYAHSENGYNLRRSNRPKTDECKEHFNKLLSDLSVSDFQLVADSVESLKDLISSFTEEESKNASSNIADIIPLCEIKLVKKLTELLNSLENVETILKDSTRKAKSKLQREWSNFKEGVEDQDSSGEGGLSSNWWVLGSQGCPLSAPGDATLQTLPQLALSSLGSQSQQPRPETSEHESAGKSTERGHCESRKSNGERRNSGEKAEDEARGRDQVEEKEQERKRKREHKHKENEVTANNEAEAEQQQTRRVLRARGVSSYTEQLYSDDESDQDELEEWTDVEAVYAAPGAPTDTSTSHAAPKVRHSDDWSETEDSDQDWILPGTRKRKNKRPSANRRLKSFQHKLQNIRENACQSNVVSNVSNSTSGKSGNDKSKDNSKRPTDSPRIISNGRERCPPIKRAIPADPKQVVPSTDTICKIETVESVHSELDIKDEGPIYDPSTVQYSENNYNSNLQQNYIVKTDSAPVNYYVMQNVGMPTTPVIGQSYYIQGTPSYLIQDPQTNFLPSAQQQPQQPQQPQQQTVIYQQQAILTQPFVNNVNYTPYTTQSQYNIVATNPPVTSQPQLRPQNAAPSALRMQGRSVSHQNRYIAPRQSLPPNATMIRNNAPVRDNCPRLNNPKFVRGKTQQQQRASNPNVTPRRRQAQQASADNTGQKTTSLIVLSDSDDEIEMIITEKATTKSGNVERNKEKGTPTSTTDRSKVTPSRTVNTVCQKPMITSDTLISSTKGIIPPQIIERMNQGGISITPVKSIAPQTAPNANTQLVVVVNETGSHYALSLPNGSKLILTPEQVAQIRASNGGRLIL
ncbi:uncharacterized protein LOC116846129 isoform X2 [Odontomachus brunneus]|uniref:uncharacterized protein LOC116846129 isoform X2 n=1 Tax=Odontomachus brunneus TaxID=486640 RepID=UPI0013F1ADB1|nr:uncharacterized protein LOC116846129 isoform X2 [Odontomachus brunneus]